MLPDVLADLLLLSTSRAEPERLCALEFLSSACCTDVDSNRQALLDLHLFRHVAKWLATPSTQERVFALQLLLAVVHADPSVVDRLVSTSGAVRSVMGALRRSIGGECVHTDCIFTHCAQ
jgi:hypothetical protein